MVRGTLALLLLSLLAVHHAVADEDIFDRVIEAVRSGADAAIPAIPVVDTIQSTGGEFIDREGLRVVQTPQAFSAPALRAAHSSGLNATDDATLVAAAGGQVVSVNGDFRNLKITHPIDIQVAKAFLAWPEISYPQGIYES